MTTYKNGEELRGRELKEYDNVIFEVEGKRIKHEVARKYLMNLSEGNNGEIFEELGVNRHHFASKYYGYPVDSDGDWPEFHSRDYKAATRMVLALFEKIDPRPKIIDRDGNIW